jgi:hypothetical protein
MFGWNTYEGEEPPKPGNEKELKTTFDRFHSSVIILGCIGLSGNITS